MRRRAGLSLFVDCMPRKPQVLVPWLSCPKFSTRQLDSCSRNDPFLHPKPVWKTTSPPSSASSVGPYCGFFSFPAYMTLWMKLAWHNGSMLGWQFIVEKPQVTTSSLFCTLFPTNLSKTLSLMLLPLKLLAVAYYLLNKEQILAVSHYLQGTL